MSNVRYCIVTACRNEALYIPGLIKCITSQTVLPFKWVIIDDGSTDATFSLAKAAGEQFSFIEARRVESRGNRSFSSQVYAQQEGYNAVRNEEFEFIAFLDADIEVGSDYYEKILAHFADDSLAIAGGLVVDKVGDKTDQSRAKSANHHVPGGVQCFRRKCYDAIGGYHPIEGGGQDTVAEITCMMRGWKVRSFLDVIVYHLRPSEGSPKTHFMAGQRWGRMCYNLGYHPMYYGLNTIMRFINRPSVRLASGQLYSFFDSTFRAKNRPVPPEFVKFVRQMQLEKLRSHIFNRTAKPLAK